MEVIGQAKDFVRDVLLGKIPKEVMVKRLVELDDIDLFMALRILMQWKGGSVINVIVVDGMCQYWEANDRIRQIVNVLSDQEREGKIALRLSKVVNDHQDNWIERFLCLTINFREDVY